MVTFRQFTEMESNENLRSMLEPHGAQYGSPDEKIKKISPTVNLHSKKEWGNYRFVKHQNGHPIAAIQVMSHTKGKGHVANAYTHPDHRRQGHGSELLGHARKLFPNLTHSDDLSDNGKGFVKKNFNESFSHVVELDPHKLKFTETGQSTTPYHSDPDNPILTYKSSSGHHVVDGHHRTLHHRAHNTPVKAIVMPEKTFHEFKAQGIHQSDMKLAYARKMRAEGRLSESENTSLMKGWMSPQGEPHLFDPSHHWYDGEHRNNHHPKSQLQPGEEVSAAQKLGYTRFGSHDGSHYIHFNKKAKGGKASALHTLNYLKPRLGSKIIVANQPRKNMKSPEEKVFDSHGAAAKYINESSDYSFINDRDGAVKAFKNHTTNLTHVLAYHKNQTPGNSYHSAFDGAKDKYIKLPHPEGFNHHHIVGYAQFDNHNVGKDVEVHKDWRGKGIGTAMYRHAKKVLGNVHPDSPSVQSDHGKKFWKHLKLEQVTETEHNIVDRYKDWGIIHPVTGKILSGMKHKTAGNHQELKSHYINTAKSGSYNQWKRAPEYAHVDDTRHEPGHLMIRQVDNQNKDQVAKAFHKLPQHHNDLVKVNSWHESNSKKAYNHIRSADFSHFDNQ